MSSIRRVTVGLLAALSVGALAACSSPIASENIAPDTQAGDNVTSGFYDGSLEHDGKERTFTVYIPPSYDGDTPLPLIVALHGGYGTGKILEDQTHLARAASERGFIVAYPDGLKRAWNAGSCCGPPAEDNIDDVGFIADMVTELNERYAIDSHRVYGTGFSNGAMLVHRIACDRPDLFQGIAAVSGGPMIENCKGADQAIPALLIQGTADPRIPFEGGEVKGSYRPAFQTVVDDFAKRDSCSAGKQQTYSRGDTTCWAREGCTDGDRVEYCEVKGGGHQWPGGKTLLHFILGDNTTNYDASSQIVAFFDKLGGDN